MKLFWSLSLMLIPIFGISQTKETILDKGENGDIEMKVTLLKNDELYVDVSENKILLTLKKRDYLVKDSTELDFFVRQHLKEIGQKANWIRGNKTKRELFVMIYALLSKYGVDTWSTFYVKE